MIVGWLIVFLLFCHVFVIKGRHTGGFAGYSETLLGSVFTSAADMYLWDTVGAGSSGGISDCDYPFFTISDRWEGNIM